MTLKTILDQAQSQLHDNGTIWTRAELLRWANDGYCNLTVDAHCVRPYQMDMPGRTAWSATYQWEDTYARGTIRFTTKSIRSISQFQATYQWEVEAIEGITPTNSLDAITQLWEQAYSDDIDDPFTFVLPKSNERPLKVYWNNKRLASTSTRERDMQATNWWRIGGMPLAWFSGSGREQSFEVFEIQTAYVQSYDLRGDLGISRQFSSDVSRSYSVKSKTQLWDYGYTLSSDLLGLVNGIGLRITVATVSALDQSYGTYSWESDTTVTSTATITQTVTAAWEDDVSLGLGAVRRLGSPDRQYLSTNYDSGMDLVGISRRFASGDNALTVWQTIAPTRSLIESDTPDLIPQQLHKYLKFYILSKAFDRAGQGYKPDLAQHFALLYKLGAGLLAMLDTPSVLDRVFAREQAQDASIKAPPRVQFPATFERIY